MLAAGSQKSVGQGVAALEGALKPWANPRAGSIQTILHRGSSLSPITPLVGRWGQNTGYQVSGNIASWLSARTRHGRPVRPIAAVTRSWVTSGRPRGPCGTHPNVAIALLPPCSRSGSKTAFQPAHRPAWGTMEDPGCTKIHLMKCCTNMVVTVSPAAVFRLKAP
jgi:hypothetical protein